MQAFVLNLRRDKFKDPRVRRALNLAFPFEDIRKTIFSGQYERVSSYFHGLELASSGLPEGQELAILESVRDKIPAKVFSEPNANPVGDTPEAVRNNLRRADRLLREAGWELKDRRRVNAKGETLTIELLGDSPNDERIYLPYKASLDRLGIVTTVRIVDDVQHVNRTRSFDFDIVSGIWGQSLSPGNEQREFWGSQAASREGSRNLAGISDPGRRRTDRPGHLRARTAPNWSLQQRRSIASCSPTTTWCRNGPPERNAPPAGTASAILKPSRAMAASGFPTIWWFDRGQGRQDGSDQVSFLTRRRLLATGAAAGLVVSPSRPGCRWRRWPRDPRHVELRRSELSGRISSISTTSIHPRQKAGRWRSRSGKRTGNQNFDTFNTLNVFVLQG